MDVMPQARRRLSGLHLVIITVMVIVVALMAWTTWAAREMVETFVPQVDATMESRVAITEAHLWLEEIVSGDAGEDPAQVWTRIADARGYLDALIQGGSAAHPDLAPVRDEALRADLLEAKGVLSRFEQIARARVGAADGGVGSQNDALFDQAFDEFFVTTVRAESHLDQVIEDALRRFLWLQAAVICTVVLLFVGLMVLLRRKEATDRDAHVRSLQASFEELARSRQELERQNALRGALVELSDCLQGLERPEEIAEVALRALCDKTGAEVGACWHREPGRGLRRLSGRALPGERQAVDRLEEGEGLVGEVARSGRVLALEVPGPYLAVGSGLGHAPPAHLRILPLVHDTSTVGVLELAFLHHPGDDAMALLDSAVPALAIRLHLATRAAARVGA